MLDTMTHIIDSTQKIINIINPGKSDFETYAPYVAVFVSLLTVAINIWLNNRQIKNSHLLLERNIEANWNNSLRSSKVNSELKLLEEYKSHRLKMLNALSEIDGNKFSVNRDNYIDMAVKLFLVEYNLLDSMKIPQIHVRMMSALETEIAYSKTIKRENKLTYLVSFVQLNYKYSEQSFKIIDFELNRILSN